MIEFYPAIKQAHISAAIVSGVLFAFRGAFVQTGAAWPMIAPLRYLSYAIDTFLVVTAIVLLTLVPASVYANGWLALKLGLLVLYVVLGSLSLKRGRTPIVRRLSFVAAVVVFLSMLAVARTHNPLGPWLLIRQWLA